MPAARAHHQRRRVVFQGIGLAGGGIGEVDRAGPAILQIGLALDHVGEHRRGRVLEVGHEDFGAGVQRVDDHLAVDRSGDLDPPVEKVGRDGRNLPVAVAHGLRLGQETRKLPGVELLLPLHPLRQEIEPAAVEAPVEIRQERQRLPAQDLRLPGARLCMDLDASGGRVRSHSWPSSGLTVSTIPRRPFCRRWGGPIAQSGRELCSPGGGATLQPRLTVRHRAEVRQCPRRPAARGRCRAARRPTCVRAAPLLLARRRPARASVKARLSAAAP